MGERNRVKDFNYVPSNVPSNVIVEQKVREVLGTCKWVYAFKSGTLLFEGVPGDLQGNKQKLRVLFLWWLWHHLTAS